MIVRRIKPQHRLKAIWALAAKRNICEPDMLDDENGDNTNEAEFNREAGAPPGHGGCGHEQPVWRKEGLKLTAVIRPPPAEKGEVRDCAFCVSINTDLPGSRRSRETANHPRRNLQCPQEDPR